MMLMKPMNPFIQFLWHRYQYIIISSYHIFWADIMHSTFHYFVCDIDRGRIVLFSVYSDHADQSRYCTDGRKTGRKVFRSYKNFRYCVTEISFTMNGLFVNYWYRLTGGLNTLCIYIYVPMQMQMKAKTYPIFTYSSLNMSWQFTILLMIFLESKIP